VKKSVLERFELCTLTNLTTVFPGIPTVSPTSIRLPPGLNYDIAFLSPSSRPLFFQLLPHKLGEGTLIALAITNLQLRELSSALM